MVSSFGGQSLEMETKRPTNIIVFMVDDMGWQDTSVPFWTESTPLNKLYHTPNMERLAAKGMKFTQAYAAPVCTPSRASLLSGVNAARHRITNWTSPYANTDSGIKDPLFKPLHWNINGLCQQSGIANTFQAKTFVQYLKEHGYYTIHVGKAHWGSVGSPGADPKNLGFVQNIAGSATGHPQSYLGKENYGNIPGKASIHAVPDLQTYYGSNTFLSEALTLEAVKALEYPLDQNQPFFLYLSHYAVHTPIMRDERFFTPYIKKGLDSIEAAYASLIEGMDKSLGDILDFLEQKNIANNTVILFMSDNGGLSLSPPRGSIAHTQNKPLRAGKGSVYEGGIRVPMIAYWPGITKPGSINNDQIMVEDFFPTILEIAKIRNESKVDGLSFVNSLRGKPNAERNLLWYYPHHWGYEGPGINFACAMRQGDWKLVYLMREAKLELYNIANDIGESKNLSLEYPDKLRQMAGAMTDLMKSRNAQLPVFEKSGLEIKYPFELIDQ